MTRLRLSIILPLRIRRSLYWFLVASSNSFLPQANLLSDPPSQRLDTPLRLEANVYCSPYIDFGFSLTERINDSTNTLLGGGGAVGHLPILRKQQANQQMALLWQVGCENTERLNLGQKQRASLFPMLNCGFGMRKRLAKSWGAPDRLFGGSLYYTGWMSRGYHCVGGSLDWLDETHYVAGSLLVPCQQANPIAPLTGHTISGQLLLKYYGKIDRIFSRKIQKNCHIEQNLYHKGLICADVEAPIYQTLPKIRLGCKLPMSTWQFGQSNQTPQMKLSFDVMQPFRQENPELNLVGRCLTAFRIEFSLGKNPLITKPNNLYVYPFLRARVIMK